MLSVSSGPIVTGDFCVIVSIKGGILCSSHMQIEMRFSRPLNAYLVGVRRIIVM